MSGHSKWATIKHKKGAADAKRGKVFSKIAKELMVVARQGGSDPGMNPTLRTLIQKAKSVNMPADNVDRAIKKGAGELEGAVFEEVVYEGYAGGGVGLIVQGLTDNKNRAAAEIRHTFTKHGSSFAQQGSVSRAFHRRGQIFIDAEGVDEDELMGVVLEAGAEDMTRDGEQFEVVTDPNTFADVTEALEAAGIATLSADVSLVSDTLVPVTDKATAASIMRFIEALEDNDDVQNVYTNMDVDDAIMQELNDE
ncbi:MAG: YebC/PmpR family DNA-binding transcriptional regulator [Kiritimatiellia bacterium]|nr:YebC/PmpR family DNA-binding transcriptional regulator [Kiritimatiellia bacterium]MDP6811209.1 YebC/PmpR family DNA-binding transcriptional regulator [Kiritimatiellia bacterium]MDP7024346.1 YebC/PmpR family DNA-binding transcriptional regulator [Kiritimatiellia bacterium]